MLTGSVKKIVPDRGFGFIAADDGDEYFFHRSGLDSTLDFDRLGGGERVTFDVEKSDRGPRAKQVRAACRLPGAGAIRRRTTRGERATAPRSVFS